MGIQTHHHHIFSGLPPSFADHLKAHASRVSFRKGDIVFKQGGAASHFFTLIQGHVALCIGRHGNVIDKVGFEYEGFGWSSMAGCGTYTASAVCIADTVVLKYDAGKLKTLLAGQTNETLRFYQNLSRTLDKRLQQSYRLLVSITNVSKQQKKDEDPIRDGFALL